MRALPAVDLYDYFVTKGLSPRTLEVYLGAFARLSSWCAEAHEDLDTIGAPALRTYGESLVWEYSTRKLARCVLGHYWDMSGRAGGPLEAIRLPRKPRASCRAFEEELTRKLAAAARARGDDPGLAVMLGLYAALRRAEIAGLTWASVRDEWLRLTGKGGVTADIPLHPVLVRELGERPRTGPWVFPSPQHARGPVTPTTVGNWVTLVGKEAGLGHITCHRLRHTALATANDITGDLRATQTFARHASPTTTAIYTRTTNRRLLAAVEALDY